MTMVEYQADNPNCRLRMCTDSYPGQTLLLKIINNTSFGKINNLLSQGRNMKHISPVLLRQITKDWESSDICYGPEYEYMEFNMLITYTAKYTKLENGYMGQLLEWPEVITEGKTLEDCRLMLKDALQEMGRCWDRKAKALKSIEITGTACKRNFGFHRIH